MSTMHKPLLFVKDTESQFAVCPNSDSVIKLFDYDDESEVPVSKVIIEFDGDFFVTTSKTYPIGEGKYKSAWWVWYWCTYFCQKQDHEGVWSFSMDAEAKRSAREYFGERLVLDAEDEKTEHQFIRDILYRGNVKVTFKTC